MHAPSNQYPPAHTRTQHQRYGVPHPRAIPHHEPMYDAPAPMPSSQLNAPDYLPRMPGAKGSLTSSAGGVGEAPMYTNSTDAQGVTANPYSDSNYLQDPGMMTPSTSTDIKGLETFMPYMGGGVGGEASDGPVDPNTGLPLFTTGKLVRSQLLGGVGAGSFLRQEQDPLSGYRRIGRRLCGVQQARRDIDVRRKQFNAERISGCKEDPVLFNVGEFAFM